MAEGACARAAGDSPRAVTGASPPSSFLGAALGPGTAAGGAAVVWGAKAMRRSTAMEKPTAGSGELDEIAWIPLDEARGLDLPAITRFVLGEVAERLETPQRPLPFVHMVRGRHVIDHQD